MRLSALLIGGLTMALVNPFASPQQNATSPPKPSNAPAPGITSSGPAASPVLAMYECDQKKCPQLAGLWLFEGNRGIAMWHVGEWADLTIKQYDGAHIVIDRVDPPEAPASKNFVGNGGSLRMQYTGAITGNRIEGSAVWDKAPKQPTTWSASITPIPCDLWQLCPLTGEQLVNFGVAAIHAKLYDAALQIFKTFPHNGYLAEGEALEAAALYWKKGGPAVDAEAFQLAQLSADQNSSLGLFVLGKFYQEGVGTKANPQLGNELLRKSQKREAEEKAEEAAARSRQPNYGAIIGSLVDWLDEDRKCPSTEAHINPRDPCYGR